MCMLNYGERFLEEDIELMIRLADLDDNGFIDFEEFVRMLTMDEEEFDKWCASNEELTPDGRKGAKVIWIQQRKRVRKDSDNGDEQKAT